MRGPANFTTAHNSITRGLVRLARACGVRARYEPRDELSHLIPPDRLQEARDARVQGMRPGIVVGLPYFINNEEGWSESTREEWLEIKTLHYGRMYTRGSFDKAPAQKRADSLRTEARAQLHALDQRLFRTADGHVGPMQGYFNERPYHGLVFGHFNETSSQVGEIMYAMALRCTDSGPSHGGCHQSA